MGERAVPPVAVAVIVHHGCVLLVRRAIPEGALAWQFPGGKVEAGESAAEAAVRETLEEVGLTVVTKDKLGERIHPTTGRVVEYYACEVLDGEARVADAAELCAVTWVALEEIPEFVPYGLYRPVQDYLDEVLS